MPNWCSNTVLIQGEPEEIGKLLMFVEQDSNPFAFNKIIVMPPQLRDQSSPVREDDVAKDNVDKYGAKDWYDWSVKNWGTKWDSNSTQIIYDRTTPMMPGDRTVRIEFETAWSPPMPVYEALAKMFPNTNIFASYNEDGVGFSGYIMYKGGKSVSEKHYDMSLSEVSRILQADESVFDYVC